ncbi:Rne/Rng family ribonuclease, partial [Myxococcota bacterium]|nr:Rne/Rng family ribonuclease [Myxococcota bacterium]
MSKKMLVNAAREGEVRVVIIQDGMLEDLNIALAGSEQIRGNVYRARVVKVEPSLQAAFIDYGGAENGFISLNDIREAYWSKQPPKGKPPRIQDVLKVGTEMVVQVIKEPMGSKGAALTCNVMLPGRYLVLMPYSSKSGVSRKIDDEEKRKRLRQILAEINPPSHTGVIIRTAGENQDLTSIRKDYQEQVRLWGHIQAKMAKFKGVGLLYSEPDVVMRSVRDYYTDDIEEVITDNEAVHRQLVQFFERYVPESVDQIKLYSGQMPLFANFGLERQFENISRPTVPLPGGGSIVISPTEALIAIDVNSGRTRRFGDHNSMVLSTNLEAAVEVARQLRLRDLGGLIVVDFIDMDELRHRQRVEQRLAEAMQMDKARVELGRISRFGLLELSRQRIKARLMLSTHELCPVCKGSGHIMTTEMASNAALRRIHELAVSAPKQAKITGRLPTQVALKLLNHQRGALAELESEFKVNISITPDADVHDDQDAFSLSFPEGRLRARRGAAPQEEEAQRRGRRGGAASRIRVKKAPQEADEAEIPYEAPRVVGFIPPAKLAEADRRVAEREINEEIVEPEVAVIEAPPRVAEARRARGGRRGAPRRAEIVEAVEAANEA